MSDDGVKLELILRPNGDITLNGPLDNKMVCFYILELARNALHTYKPAQTTSITRVPADLLKHLGPNGKNGD